MRTLTAATCQFSVEADIDHNLRKITGLIQKAADGNADVVHFSECALSGYAGVDVPGTSDIDWPHLKAATQEIQRLARKHKLWVLLGSTHPLSAGVKPHNSVYIINAKGQIVERYDKRFCTGTLGKQPKLDLAHYSPGNRFATFKVKDITCGVLICYDYRFPELYREYKRQGVEVLFQSFHNARASVVADESYDIWRTIVPATMCCRAAENHMWVSANNSAARPSRWGSFSVRPDGQILGQLRRHQTGLLLTEMRIDPTLFDAPGPWREAAMNGQLHSGCLIDDPRSRDVTCL
jgi:predicted amidohydrolase